MAVYRVCLSIGPGGASSIAVVCEGGGGRARECECCGRYRGRVGSCGSTVAATKMAGRVRSSMGETTTESGGMAVLSVNLVRQEWVHRGSACGSEKEGVKVESRLV